MSYRGEYIQSSDRPLIDLIPEGENIRVGGANEVSYKEDDYLIHPEWKALVSRTTNRVPKRVQRYIIIYLILLVIAFIVWRNHFGPKYEKYKHELALMDATPKMSYGSNVPPEFKDMIHVKTLDERHLPRENKRLVAIGDVHGCIDELKALLQKVEFNEKTDHLILTGDIVAKGPDSSAVVSLAQALGASCVRGNHEDKLLLYIDNAKATHAHLPNIDDDANLVSNLQEDALSNSNDKLRKLAKQFSKEQVEWLKQCPVILRVGDVTGIGDVVVVHAGLVPGVPLERQDPFQCMNMRTIDLKTRLPSEGRDHTEWEKFWNHQQKKLPAEERTTVIYGHDARRGKNIEKYSKGLDSSCVRGGHLTALVIDSQGKEEIVQVKCKGYVQ